MVEEEGEICSELVPELSGHGHKGSCGRVGVVGGSREFTGAPYFSAISALRAGADLAYVFTNEAAAQPIKSYSPELMVLPYLDEPHSITPWLKKLHTLVVGPGLGRTPSAFENARNILQKVKGVYTEEGCCSSLVFDADGLFCMDPSLLEDYRGHIYLTPNVVELPHLTKGLTAEELSKKLGPKYTLIVKGPEDRIWHDSKMVKCGVEGSNRRCGGQGDILSGVLATFAWWAFSHSGAGYNLKAAYNASALTRTANRLAFHEKSRSMLASDMIQHLPKAFNLLFKK